MSVGIIIKGTVIEDQPAFLMRRIRTPADVDIAQADLATVAYTIYDLADESVVVASTGLVIATVIFDTLQVTTAWTSQGGNADGYNFGAELPGASWPNHGTKLRVQVLFTPNSGNPFAALYEVDVVKYLGS